jgi:hypothetical protein
MKKRGRIGSHADMKPGMRRAYLAALERDGIDDPLLKGKDRRNKYHAVKVVQPDGTVIDSKHEARVLAYLAHEGVAVIPQVSIPLGKNPQSGRMQRIRLDALVILEVRDDGTFVGKFVDAKGLQTRDWTTKRNWFEQLYKARINIQ